MSVHFFVMAGGFWYASVLVDNGNASFAGVMQAFLGVLYAGMGAGQALADLGNVTAAKVACRDMFALMDRKSLVNGLEPVGDMPMSSTDVGRITFGCVRFQYSFRPDVELLKSLFSNSPITGNDGSTGSSSSANSNGSELSAGVHSVDLAKCVDTHGFLQRHTLGDAVQSGFRVSRKTCLALVRPTQTARHRCLCSASCPPRIKAKIAEKKATPKENLPRTPLRRNRWSNIRSVEAGGSTVADVPCSTEAHTRFCDDHVLDGGAVSRSPVHQQLPRSRLRWDTPGIVVERVAELSPGRSHGLKPLRVWRAMSTKSRTVCGSCAKRPMWRLSGARRARSAALIQRKRRCVVQASLMT